MLDWFARRERIDIHVDIHSHLLPGLDDGVKTMDEALRVITSFANLGYRKLITTPHIYPDHYPNTPETILSALEEVQRRLEKEDLAIKLEAAAEYFIDSEFIGTLDKGGKILHFGSERYVLVETAFYSKSIMFDEAVFKLKSNGYSPVLAHPERYEYLEQDLSWLKSIREQGVKLQVSIPSIIGGYGKQPKKVARELFRANMVDFLGSDIHRKQQMRSFSKALNKKIRPQALLNDSLL